MLYNTYPPILVLHNSYMSIPRPLLGYQQMMGRAPIICVARLVQSRGRCLHSEVWSGLVR
ncbi:hypothetical protein CC2G_002718 [Coprinopsis cinerea AmutBmut pab1-1]|nr:hypothetical protein CC2G_002718 [Coprinopsis cinerea AmutBmut pab1-1]